MSADPTASPDRAQPKAGGVEVAAASEGTQTKQVDDREYIGVKWSARLEEWVAWVRLDSREAVNFGSRKSAEAAARLHDCGVILLFGCNSVTNFPMQTYGEEELERARKQLRPLLAGGIHARDAIRRDIRRFTERDPNLMRPAPPRAGAGAGAGPTNNAQPSELLVGHLGFEHAHTGAEKENCPAGVFVGSGFKPNAGNFQQWSRRTGMVLGRSEPASGFVEKRPLLHAESLVRGGVSHKKSWGQGGGREIGRRVAARTPKVCRSDAASYQGWGIKKPTRKARTRTCRRVPPPIPAAPLGSTKWQYRGISWNQALGLWTAYLYDPENKKTVYLGTRKSQQEAAALHDWGMLILQGPDAVTNFPKCSSKPTLQELKQVKDRLVAARSVTEEVASDRMCGMLPEDEARQNHDAGKWCTPDFPQDFSRRMNHAHTSQSLTSVKTFPGLGDPPHLPHRRCAGLPGHCMHGGHCTLCPLFDAVDEGHHPMNGPIWQRVDMANAQIRHSPPILGPKVATGVNLIESGPLAGQYLILVQMEGKETMMPVGYAPTAMQAAQVHDMVVLALHGPRAGLNFPASSYQLRAIGSVLGALPHLFPPHTFWKGMAAAEAAGVKNDINFPGVRTIAPCSTGDFVLPISGFCPRFFSPHDHNSPNQDSNHHDGKPRKKAQLPHTTLSSDVGDIMKQDTMVSQSTRQSMDCDNRHKKWFESLISASRVNNGCKTGLMLENGGPHKVDAGSEGFFEVPDLAEPTLDHSDHSNIHMGDLQTKSGDMNEEELRAARTLTILGTVGKMGSKDGGSDASDAGDAKVHSASSNDANFHGVSVLQKDVYLASIEYKGQLVSIGQYDDPVQAARAYDMVALGLNGSATWTNFPPSSFCSIEIQAAVRNLQLCSDHTSSNAIIDMAENDEVDTSGKAVCSGGVTRKGRVVRKPKRFQQGLSQMQFWECPMGRWVENIENTRSQGNGPKPLSGRDISPVEAKAF